MCVAGGVLVTAIGVLISGALAIWSLVRTTRLQAAQVKLGEDQNKLAEEQNTLLAEQNEIARRQVEGSTPYVPPGISHASSPVHRHAHFRVVLTPSGRSERLIILNDGNGQAFDVELNIDPPRDLVGGSPQEFPLLDPRQDWRLPFARAFGSPDRYQWKIAWTEKPDDTRRKQEGWIAPP